METLENDVKSLLGEEMYRRLPHDHRQEGGHSSDRNLAVNYFGQLSREQVLKLYDIYKLDHDLYGYDVQTHVAMTKK